MPHPDVQIAGESYSHMGAQCFKNLPNTRCSKYSVHESPETHITFLKGAVRENGNEQQLYI